MTHPTPTSTPPVGPGRPLSRSVGRRVAAWFARGLLIIAPAVITVYICWLVIRWVDGLLGIDIPGVGIVVALVAITAVGALASTFVTRAALGLLDDLLERLPFVRLLYTSSKDLLNAFVGDRRRFTKAVRVSLTEDGAVGALGFVTDESLERLGLPGYVAVYLPQSYNFAGQMLTVRADRVSPLLVDSGDVMAFVVSGGVATTTGKSQS